MSQQIPTKSSKICPTCGTRLSEDATRCLVCGRTFSKEQKKENAKSIQGPRMPELTLTLPIALGLMIIILGIGAGVVFAVLQGTGRVLEPTLPATVTLTPTSSATPTASTTPSPLPTFTPLPPIEYQVQDGDFCSSIAAFFNVSIQSIVLQNNLPADCGTLRIGQTLLIPQPTPTASPLPTSTLSGADATEAACEKYVYTVSENDTLSGIAASFNVSINSIKEYNGLTRDMVFQSEVITIPLCERLPTPGATPTPTLPPPYAAPNLLLPANGTSYMSGDEIITLQWASVGELRANEAYAVTIEDITDGTGKKLTEYVTDTKFIVPDDFKPTENVPHIIRWSILPVRQSGSTQDGEAIYEVFGTLSEQRVFSWWGVGTSTNN